MLMEDIPLICGNNAPRVTNRRKVFLRSKTGCGMEDNPTRAKISSERQFSHKAARKSL